MGKSLDIGELLLVIPAGNLLLLVIPEAGVPDGRICPLGWEAGVPDGRICSLGWEAGVPSERFCSLGLEGNLLLLVNLRHKNEIRAAPHIVCGPAIGLAKVANNLPKLRTD
jgi:hypothetical protein